MIQLTMQRVLDSLACAVVICDARLTIMEMNTSAEDWLGISKRIAADSHLSSLFRGGDEIVEAAQCVLGNERRLTLREVRFSTSQRELFMDVTVGGVSIEEAGNIVVVEMQPIDRVARLATETMQFDRHQSYRMMMRGLSHEIRNPLSGLRGAAQLLERELDSPQHKDYTNIMIRETDRLTALVDRIMGGAGSP